PGRDREHEQHPLRRGIGSAQHAGQPGPAHRPRAAGVRARREAALQQRGYALLAYVIEKAAGRPYEDYLRQSVLDPLGLRDTRHESDPMVVRGRAYGYTVSPEERGALVVAPFQQMATKTGGGSLVSTARDLHR